MTLEEEFSLLLDCGVTLEEDFALLLDFAELLLESSLRELEELVAISLLLLDTLVSLLLDFGVTLEDDERTELLDRSSTGAEDDERTELLLASSQSSQTLDEVGSSSRGAKLLSSVVTGGKKYESQSQQKTLHTENPPTLRCIFSKFSF